jgi:ubiquinone/menaquinone biosynthesis C-methylase UbiE
MTVAPASVTEAEKVRAAFDKAALHYDSTWTCSLLGRLQREQVWQVMDRIFTPGERILDMACGTGADAIHLAARGVRVHATDISREMLQATRRKLLSAGQDHAVTTELLAGQTLFPLKDRGPFDGAMSNFGAINCIPDLRRAALELAQVLPPGAPFLVCSMGRFCLWESIWYLSRAQRRKAVRRWRGVATASLERELPFEVFYPSIARIKEAFAEEFQLRSWRGIGVFVPPSYVTLANDHPRLFTHMAKLDRLFGGWPLVRALADHRLMLFTRR